MMTISDHLIRTLKRRFAGSMVLPFVFALNPVPAARPRISKWGAHYPKKYATWRTEALQYVPHMGKAKYSGPLMVVLEHVVERPKTTKRGYPIGDVDNYAKGPLDAITESGRVWDDDDQVVVLVSTKRFTKPGEEPGTHTWIMEINPDD